MALGIKFQTMGPLYLTLFLWKGCPFYEIYENWDFCDLAIG